MNGYTYDMPESRRLVNEYQTCSALWLETLSDYWRNRTENAIRKLEDIGILAPLPDPLKVNTFERSNTVTKEDFLISVAIGLAGFLIVAAMYISRLGG